MRSTLFAALAFLMLAGSSLYAAEPVPAGIGLKWGVGYAQFDDSRLTAVNQIVEISFKIDTAVSLVISHEQASVAFDDRNGVSFDTTADLTGLGIMCDVNKMVKAGIAIGKCNDSDFGITSPYADVAAEVSLLEGKGEKIGYSLAVGLKYRFIETGNIGTPTGPDIENMNCTLISLKLGVMF